MKWSLSPVKSKLVRTQSLRLRLGRKDFIGFLILCVFLSLLIFKNYYEAKWKYKYGGWKIRDFNLPKKAYEGKEITILRWTGEWGVRGNDEILHAKDCPWISVPGYSPSTSSKVFDIPCKITYDRKYLRESDALVFHSYDLLNEGMPEERDLNQPWVYEQRESPIYTDPDLRPYHNVFNWTMTYRRDSDVYFPYGHLVPIQQSDKEYLKIKSQLKNKTHQVAWIVSRCHASSKREHLVNHLQSHINIDIYGKCGKSCPSSKDCHSHISKKYKFYLSFENSLCKDYITEKFFKALHVGLVPIVYGGTRSSDYLSIAPKGSYIDVRDFKSPKELVNYLIHLDGNDKEYMKYFEWKKSLKVVWTQGWCNLCQRVYDHRQTLISKSGERKSYNDLWKWWNFIKGKHNESEPACLYPLANLTGMNMNDGGPSFQKESESEK